MVGKKKCPSHTLMERGTPCYDYQVDLLGSDFSYPRSTEMTLLAWSKKFVG